MKSWVSMLIVCVALAAPSGAARAQGEGSASIAAIVQGGATPVTATPVAAPRDTAHAGIRYVYLIRHAWYDGSDPRDERIGKGIDSLGRAQSKLVAERLAGLPIHVDQLVSSSFTRARETADIIGAALHMPAVRDSDISECTPPSNRPDYMRDMTPGEGDSCVAALERAWARYMRPAGGRDDKHDVLVAHGNVIRWMVSRMLRIDTLRWPEFNVGNCSITAIAVRPDGTMMLAAFSDTGHLPAAAQTWTGRGAGWSPPAPRRPAAAGSMGAGRTGNPIIAPAPEAAHDTLRHVRSKDR